MNNRISLRFPGAARFFPFNERACARLNWSRPEIGESSAPLPPPRKQDSDKARPNPNYRIESRLMDAISLSAKTTRCAGEKVDGGEIRLPRGSR